MNEWLEILIVFGVILAFVLLCFIGCLIAKLINHIDDKKLDKREKHFKKILPNMYNYVVSTMDKIHKAHDAQWKLERQYKDNCKDIEQLRTDIQYLSNDSQFCQPKQNKIDKLLQENTHIQDSIHILEQELHQLKTEKYVLASTIYHMSIFKYDIHEDDDIQRED